MLYKMTAKQLIRNATYIDGYVNPVSYYPEHDSENGFWLCMECESNSYSGSTFFPHEENCKLPRYFHDSKKSNKFCYVLGDNENGFCAPFKREDIPNIIKSAKDNYSDI